MYQTELICCLRNNYGKDVFFYLIILMKISHDHPQCLRNFLPSSNVFHDFDDSYFIFSWSGQLSLCGKAPDSYHLPLTVTNGSARCHNCSVNYHIEAVRRVIKLFILFGGRMKIKRWAGGAIEAVSVFSFACITVLNSKLKFRSRFVLVSLILS